jgi:zinc transport system substrate-binding protein
VKRAIGAILGVALLLAACGDKAAPSADHFVVLTAFYPLQFVAERVGGDAVAVTNLTPPGGEPHDLELKPSDVRQLRDADLILYFGRGFQPSIEDAIKQIPDTSKAIDLLAGLPLKPPPAGEEEEALSADPHVWLDPILLLRIVGPVEQAIVEVLPAKAGDVRRRASALRGELTAFHSEAGNELSNCERREFFTSHDAFSYLADRYMLRQVPITGLSPEAEPSSKRLQEIAQQARAADATTIFFETLVSPRVSQAVARIVGAKTAVLDPLEGLENPARGADYFSIMRQNVAALVKALRCRT